MLRSVLSPPQVYNLFQHVVGAPACRRVFADEYIRPKRTERVLDIGCGPGSMLPYMEGADYIGFDMSAAYIEAARKQFGIRGKFVCERVSATTLDEPGTYDLVLASGIVHHLDDTEAQRLFEIAALALKPDGRLVTQDPAFVPNQHRIARFVVSRDRGEHVRGPEDYARIARSSFRDVTMHVRHDLLRIPYTHVVLQCTTPIKPS